MQYMNDGVMEIAINRKATMYRHNTPNATTVAAMKEAENDENLTTVNMDSYESFLKSLDL